MFITMNCTSASPAGVLHFGHTYNLPSALAKKILSAKIAGTTIAAAVIESDPVRIARARKGIDAAVQRTESGEEFYGSDE